MQPMLSILEDEAPDTLVGPDDGTGTSPGVGNRFTATVRSQPGAVTGHGRSGSGRQRQRVVGPR